MAQSSPTTPSVDVENGFDAHDSADASANAGYLSSSAGGGYQFAAQYIDQTTSANQNNAYNAPDGPVVTQTQLNEEHAAGLSTVSIFQTQGMTGNPYYGAAPDYESYLTVAQGKIDAQEAFQSAEQLGQPAGSAIYFAMDFDPQRSEIGGYGANYSEATTLTNVTNYFQGINDYIASLPAGATTYRIGVYGAGDTIAAVTKNVVTLNGDGEVGTAFTNPAYTPNATALGWLSQSYAWAGSAQGNANSTGLALYQQNTVTVTASPPPPAPYNAQVQIDPDEAGTADFGQWLCFATGTTIRTLRGDVAVEELTAGDFVVTASGALRPIVWIGQRTIDCAAAPIPSEVWPVRIRAQAFGAGLPERDLFLSPGHPVLVGEGESEVLVPIMCLVNGTTIARVPVDQVTYWHVELDEHDILLAEGLPAESYLDFGNRPWFENGSDHALHNPDFIAPGLDGRCRPVAVDGPLVEAERRRLDGVFEMRLSAQCAWPSADGVSIGV